MLVDGRVARGEMGVIDHYGGDERSPSPADRRMLRVFGQIENADLSCEDSQIRHSIRHRLRVLAEDGVLLISAVIYDALGCQGVGDLRSCECSGHTPEHPFVEAVNIVVGTQPGGSQPSAQAYQAGSPRPPAPAHRLKAKRPHTPARLAISQHTSISRLNENESDCQ